MRAQRIPGTNIVAVYNPARAPTNAEWSAVLDLLTGEPRATRILIRTRGGAPNPVQREELLAKLKGDPPLTALLTESAIVRGTVTLLRWFWKQAIAAFNPSDEGKAAAFLSLSPEELARTKSALAELERDVESKESQRAHGAG